MAVLVKKQILEKVIYSLLLCVKFTTRANVQLIL